MRKYLTQLCLFRALIILAIAGILYDVFNSVVFPFGLAHPFSYFGFAKPIIFSGLKSIFISIFMIVMYKLRFRVAFFIMLGLSIYYMLNYNPLIGRPILRLFGSSTPLKMDIVILLNLFEAVVASIGVVIVIRDYIQSQRQNK